jgi:hypothetical protein
MAGTTRWLLLGVLGIVAIAARGEAQVLAAGRTERRPPHSLVADVNLLGKAVPPWIHERWVVFSYRPTETARFVAVRFAHEDYAVLHPLEVNERGTFVLIYQPPPGLDTLTYRMSVDGLWMRDPSNPRHRTDSFGTSYSLVDLAALPAAPAPGPIVETGGRVTFSLRADPNRLVSVAGSFNRWDPFVHVLDEVNAGLYRITLRLPPGEYYYYFLDSGRKTLDPANVQIRRNADGELVSAFPVP